MNPILHSTDRSRLWEFLQNGELEKLKYIGCSHMTLLLLLESKFLLVALRREDLGDNN